MPEQIQVRVRGRSFEGWKNAQVYRGLEAVAGGFEITMRDQNPRAATPGQEIQITYGNRRTPLLEGYIDRIRSRGSTREAVISGRDRTADAVDASAGVAEDGSEVFEYSGILLGDLAAALLGPLGIELDLQAVSTGDRFDKFAIEPGESVHTAIERGSRQRAFLNFTDGSGRWVLARPGNQRATRELLWGENILDYDLDLSASDRFSVYIVKAQRSGSDNEFGEVVAAVEGRASDNEVSRFRPLVVVAEGHGTTASAEARAQWESIFRAARSARLRIQTQGLREFRNVATSDLWQPNRLVRARIPPLRVDNEFLISTCRYIVDLERGETTSMTLVRPDAYTPKETIDDEGGFDDFLGEWDIVEGQVVPAGEDR